VSPPFYKLNETGVEASKELVYLVYQTNCTDTKIAHDTGLDCGRTIPKLLGKNNDKMQLKKIVSFFKSLLKKIKNQQERDRYIKKYNFEKFYQNIDENELSSFLPKLLYDNNIAEPKLPIPSENTLISSNLRHDLIQALWSLDYEDQEDEFRIALKSQSKNLAFTFAAPCDVTQSWIFNRLLRKIARKDNRKIFTIDLKNSDVRNDYDKFLMHLSGLLNTKPDCNEILDRIYEINSEMSIVIVIKNFKKRRKIQEDIMTRFWSDLCHKSFEENRVGRVILIWMDDCLLDYSCSIVELEELVEIDQKNINDWINEYGGLYPFLNNLSTCDFASDRLNWDWNDPWLILNNICRKFELNGITDLQVLWEGNL
jgi:uncharacterized protein YehS (DUF1456 family)